MVAPLIIPNSGNPWVDWWVRLWGRVSPTDYSDPYPQTLDILQHGWFQVHQTLLARDWIILERRKFGMEVYCYEDKATYKLSDIAMWGNSDNLMDNLNRLPVTAEAQTLVFPVTDVTNYQVLHNLGKRVSVTCINSLWQYASCGLTFINDNEVDAEFLTPFTGEIIII
jgi:hypothetical protein